MIGIGMIAVPISIKLGEIHESGVRQNFRLRAVHSRSRVTLVLPFAFWSVRPSKLELGCCCAKGAADFMNNRSLPSVTETGAPA
jgi:hypothetical protein